MRHLIIIFVALFALVQNQSSTASTISDQLVDEGRALLFDTDNYPANNPTYSGLVAANEKFLSAVAMDSSDPLANLFYAVTRVAVTYVEQGDAAGIETARELLEAFGFTRSPEDSIDFPAYNDPPQIDGDGEYIPPTSIPSGQEFQDFLKGDFLTLIDSAIGNLNVITSPTFTTTLTIAETGDPYSPPVEIDYGDVLLVKSFLYTLKASIQILSAYDMDINLRETIILRNADVIQFQRDLLDKYSNFLKLHTDGASRLTSAKTTLSLAIDTCRAAFNFILNETDVQYDDLFSFGSEEEVVEARTFLAVLTETQNSVFDNRPFTETEEEWTISITDGPQMELDIIKDFQGNLIEGYMTDYQGFYAWVNDYSVVGSTILIDFGFEYSDGFYCPGTLSTSGTLNGEQNQITGGSFNYTDCNTIQPESGSFTGTRHFSETESLLDANAVFGNTGKSPLDIRDISPTFDTDNEMVGGTFPQPYFNNVIPGISTELQLVNHTELWVAYDVQYDDTITLDGGGTDWPDSLAVAVDDINDAWMSEPYGNDIFGLSAAWDSNYFYWMMELNDPPVHNNINYTFVASGETNNKTLVSNVYNGTYGLNAYSQSGSELISSDPNDMGAGNVVEARIPIEQFDGTVKIDVDVYSNDHIGDHILLKLPNDADLTGSVSCETCYGSGKIFIYVFDASAPPFTNNLLGSDVLESSGSGSYTVTGLPIGKEVYVFAVWDADDNGILTYGDYTNDSSICSVEISGTGATCDINITYEKRSSVFYGGIFSDNRVYSDFFTNAVDSYEMWGWARSIDKTLPVYAQNIPLNSVPQQVEIPYLSKLDQLNPPVYHYAMKFGVQDGFSPPGTDWENTTFLIYIDKNYNGLPDPDETVYQKTFPAESLQPLDIPQVEIIGQKNPTITWLPVPEADSYDIRFWEITEDRRLGDLVFRISGPAGDSSSYSYTYDGDLFSQYSTLAVSVMANEIIGSGIFNRSTYFTTHSPVVNMPGVMLLLLD